MENLSDFQRFLLLRISTETMAIRLSNIRRFGSNSLEVVIPYSPQRWLGHPATVGDRKRISRDCVELERRGFLVRIAKGGTTRTTHVRMIEAGLLAAEQIAGEGVDEV